MRSKSFEQREDAVVFEYARRSRGRRELKWFETVENQKVPSFAHDMSQTLSLFISSGSARYKLFVRLITEERGRFVKKQVGRRGELFTTARGEKRPRKSTIATRPALIRERGSPVRDQRSLPFTAKGDKRDDVSARRFSVADLAPRGVQQTELVVTTNKFRWCKVIDARDLSAKVDGCCEWRNPGGEETQLVFVFEKVIGEVCLLDRLAVRRL